MFINLKAELDLMQNRGVDNFVFKILPSLLLPVRHLVTIDGLVDFILHFT